MRPLILRRDSDDRGAVLVWVALMLGVLIGFGALVIDVGALYAERRQLQNGADAAAFAVAADCANDNNCNKTTGDAKTHANEYADKNANDGAATVDEVCGSGPGLPPCVTPPPGTAGKSNWVQVKTSTDNPANSNPTQVRFLLAPVLNALNKGSTVKASAVAAWGPVGGATTIPFTFSVCEFVALGGSLDALTFPNTPGYIYQHGTGPAGYHDCLGNPSGQNVPGGFGWLGSTACEAAVTVGGWVGSDTGNPMPTDCNMTSWQNAEVLIPLYNETRGTGSNAEYRIVGFAGFKVLAYDFGNKKDDSWSADGTKFDCPPNGNDERCFYGQFTRVTATGDIGGGTDYGARTISMIG